MKELKAKILEALVSALPITAIVYLIALLPVFDFQMSVAELATFSVGAVLLVLGIGLFNLGADLAMTPTSSISKCRKGGGGNSGSLRTSKTG